MKQIGIGLASITERIDMSLANIFCLLYQCNELKKSTRLSVVFQPSHYEKDYGDYEMKMTELSSKIILQNIHEYIYKAIYRIVHLKNIASKMNNQLYFLETPYKWMLNEFPTLEQFQKKWHNVLLFNELELSYYTIENHVMKRNTHVFHRDKVVSKDDHSVLDAYETLYGTPLGDIAKTAIHDTECKHYFLVDDDIYYPSDYISHSLENYIPNTLCSYHGVGTIHHYLLNRWNTSDPSIKNLLTRELFIDFEGAVEKTVLGIQIGTGVCFYGNFVKHHMNTVLKAEKKEPNALDDHYSNIARKSQITMMIVQKPHKALFNRKISAEQEQLSIQECNIHHNYTTSWLKGNYQFDFKLCQMKKSKVNAVPFVTIPRLNITNEYKEKMIIFVPYSIRNDVQIHKGLENMVPHISIELSVLSDKHFKENSLKNTDVFKELLFRNPNVRISFWDGFHLLSIKDTLPTISSFNDFEKMIIVHGCYKYMLNKPFHIPEYDEFLKDKLIFLKKGY